MAIPRPQVRDDISLLGSHYFLSKQDGKWAIRKDSQWVTLDSSFTFTYLGPDKDKIGTSSWLVVPKAGSATLKSLTTPKADTGLPTFEVKIFLNREQHKFEFKARDVEHAKRLAFGALTKKLGISIPLLRHQLLPDAIQITKLSHETN